MTSFELRAGIVLWVAKLLRVKLRDLYDSYPYNPYSKSEVQQFFSKGQKHEAHRRN